MRAAHADYYARWSPAPHPTCGTRQAEAVGLLGLELPNLRAAVRHLVYTDRLDDAGDFAWSLLVYWWISGFFSEVRLWMLELLGKEQPISPRTRAIAWFFALWGEMWRRPSEQVVAGLGECVRLFAESGDEEAAAMALAARATHADAVPDLDVADGRGGAQEAVDELRRSATGGPRRSQRSGSVSSRSCEAHRQGARRTSTARREWRREQDMLHAGRRGQQRRRAWLSSRATWRLRSGGSSRPRLVGPLHYDEGARTRLEGISAIAAIRGDGGRAGVLAAVTPAIRQRRQCSTRGVRGARAPLDAAARGRPRRRSRPASAAGADMSVAEAIARRAAATRDETLPRGTRAKW